MGRKPDANSETRESAPGPAVSTDGQRQTGPRALSQTRCRPGRPLKVMFQTLKSRHRLLIICFVSFSKKWRAKEHSGKPHSS